MSPPGLAGAGRALAWALLLGIVLGAALGLRESIAQGWWASGLERLAWLELREQTQTALAVALGVAAALMLAARSWQRSRAATLVGIAVVACALALRFELAEALRARLPEAWPRAAKLALLGCVVLGGAALFVWGGPLLARGIASVARLPAVQRVLRARAVVFLAVCAALGLGALEARVQIDRRHRPVGPNIVLITVDTLRADHLGCYGHDRPTSPNIDRLASRGVLFRHALAQAPWTLPSMASVQTALYPSQHGADNAERRLPADVDTLAEVLRNAGYRTLAVTSHVFVSPRYGLDQGFAEFETRLQDHEDVGSERVTRGALERLGEHPHEPFFLWVHYFDPHLSYMPHADTFFADGYSGTLPRRIRYAEVEALEAAGATSPADLAYVKGLYDEEIAYTDAQIGALIDGIERLRLGRDTVTVLTADHGDCFGERGRFGHGKDVFPELVHVPLIVAGAPQVTGARVFEAPVETKSIAATLLALAGVSAPGFHGENLLQLADEADPERLLFVEGSYAWGYGESKVAVVSGDGWKLVQHLDSGERELYQTKSDPDERLNLVAKEDPAVVAVRERLQTALDEFIAQRARFRASLALDPAELEHLRQLGYAE